MPSMSPHDLVSWGCQRTIGEWMGGGIVGWISELVDGWMDLWMDRWIGRWMNGWVD